MTYEIAIVGVNEYFDLQLLQPQLTFQSANKSIDQINILRGSFLNTCLEFCNAHRSKLCAKCVIDSCDQCCFKYRVVRDLSALQLIIKTGDPSQKKIWFEAQIQQRLFEQFPENVAQCIGNYTDFYYFVRRKGAENWLLAKIALLIFPSDDRTRTSSIDNLAVPRPEKMFVQPFETVCALLKDSLLEMAVLMNSATHESRNQLRIDWVDEDFQRRHNYFVVSTEKLDVYNYVFFDFGHNVCLSAS